MFLLIILFVFGFNLCLCEGSTCQASDFDYKYTECDNAKKRWRVAVPKPNSNCEGGVPFPKEGTDCSFTCDQGKFLDLESQECRDCPAGTYSLGGGQRYDEFKDLQHVNDMGFNIRTSAESQMTVTEGGKKEKCPEKGGWMVKEGFLIYLPTPCTSVLSYSARLVRAGKVKYVYRLPKKNSIYFTVDVQNEQCQSYSDRLRTLLSSPSGGKTDTSRGSWVVGSVNLKSGQNVVSWKVPGRRKLERTSNEPIIIARIDVIGLAYTEECSSCPSGTFSSAGSQMCTPCKPNTFSGRKADSCIACPETEYSGPKASICMARPTCKASDYYKVHEPCDSNRKTKVTYKWVQPRVCRDDVADAAKLPSDSVENCPKCNAGMSLEKTTGKCTFCKEDQFSDGNSDCAKCPTNTAPNYGYQFEWWNNLPENMVSRCQIVSDETMAEQRKCEGEESWLPAGDRIHTAHTRQSGVALELGLSVREGFSNPLTTGEPSQQNPVGHVTFEFSTKCHSGDCQFYFVEQGTKESLSGDNMRVIALWNGTVRQSSYSHPVTNKRAVDFIWAFVRSDAATGAAVDSDYFDEEASIHVINVTNTKDGGASACLPCPVLQSGTKGCVPCPPGHFMDSTTRRCIKCPVDTMLNTSSARIGKDSCLKCGPHLRSKDGMKCITDGKFTIKVDKNERKYDLTELGKRLYEASGVKVYGQEGGYFHVFNVSLFEEFGATCSDTFGEYRGFSLLPEEKTVTCFICRSTVLPLRDLNDTARPVYISPIVLGTKLLAISAQHHYRHIKINLAHIDIEPKSVNKPLDVHFYYKGDTQQTSHCPYGQSVVVTIRCDPMENGTRVDLPRACPDGTCDGCLYHILITSLQACPLCTPKDYQLIRGECHNGLQEIHSIPDTQCVLSGKQRHSETVTCVMFGMQVQILIAVSSALAIFLCCLVVIVCRRNRKLEYKYMKLVASAGDKGYGELAAAESCALHEGEDDEEDKVIFSRGRDKKREGFFRTKASDEKRAFAFENEEEEDG